MVTDAERNDVRQLTPWTVRTRAVPFVTRRVNPPARMGTYRMDRFLARGSSRKLGASQGDSLASWTSSCDSSNSAPSPSLAHASESHIVTHACADAMLFNPLGIRFAPS